MIRRTIIGLAAIVIMIFVAKTGYAATNKDNPYSIELNSNYTDHVTRWDDVHYYQFVLPAPGAIKLTISNDYDNAYEAQWLMTILDEADHVILKRLHLGKTTEESTPHIGLPAGTYLLRIAPGSSSHSPTEYTIVMEYTQSETWEIESNDHLDISNPIALNTEYSGSVLRYDDHDYYNFTLPAPGSVSLDFSHEFVDNRASLWDIELTNKEGKRYYFGWFQGNDSSVNTTNNIGLPEGTYYIHVSAVSASNEDSSDYKLKVNYTQTEFYEKEFNDNMVSVNPIELNTEYTGSMIADNDKDYYKFTLQEPGFVRISFSHEYVDSNSDLWKLSVMDDEEKEYFSSSYKGNALKTIESSAIGLPKGSYYLKISSRDFSPAEYLFSVNFTASDAWETEFNDNPHDANEIIPGQKINGALARRSQEKDKDCYRIEIPTDAFLGLTLEHAYIDRASPEWRIDVKDDEGNERESFRFTKKEEKEEQSTQLLPAGTYYVLISAGNDDSLLDYQLTLDLRDSSSAASDEAGNSEWECPVCGQKNNTNFCVSCGAKKPETQVCPVCGASVEPNFAFCGSCGAKLK